MFILGALITFGAALVLLIVGALALFGGANATQQQVVPGFRPDRPGPIARLLTLLGVWGPIALIALLCLLAAMKMLQVALGAL